MSSAFTLSTPGQQADIAVGAADHAGALLTIDLGAVADNWLTLKGMAADGADCAAVLKANAYGLGAVPVAQALAAAGCRNFFVAHVDEGIALRRHLPAAANLFVLHGAPPGAEEACAANGLIPILNSLPQLRAWVALCGRWSRRLPAGVQVDSGMARAGMDAAELAELDAVPELLAAFDLRLIMSHLACADEPESPMNREQLQAFNVLRARFPQVPASFANSSGVFLGKEWHFDLLRPGVALYGGNPTPGKPNPMKPVVRLRAKIMQMRAVPAGASVGYGRGHITAAPSRIATAGVGYADGFFRCLGGKAQAYWADTPLPIVGRVSMDMITVDVTTVPEDLLYPGALIDLIGTHRTVDDLATEAGTISYEILTSLGNRYHRTYINGTGRVASVSSSL